MLPSAVCSARLAGTCSMLVDAPETVVLVSASKMQLSCWWLPLYMTYDVLTRHSSVSLTARIDVGGISAPHVASWQIILSSRRQCCAGHKWEAAAGLAGPEKSPHQCSTCSCLRRCLDLPLTMSLIYLTPAGLWLCSLVAPRSLDHACSWSSAVPQLSHK